MRQQTGFSIAYIDIRETLPESGIYRKFFFFTIKDDKYYWGTSNNSFTLNQMEERESRGTVLKLPDPQPLEIGMGIFINNIGEVFYADLVNPCSNNPEMKYLCTFDVSRFPK
jgi:hypothetical protein